MKRARGLWTNFVLSILVGILLSVKTLVSPYAIDCPQLIGDCTGGYCPGNQICVSKGKFCDCEYTQPPWPE